MQEDLSSRTARATQKTTEIYHEVFLPTYSVHSGFLTSSPDERNVSQKADILFLFSALEEVLPQDTKAALLQEEGTTFLVLMTLVQKRVLMLLMKQPEDEISVVEAVAPLEVSSTENSWFERRAASSTAGRPVSTVCLLLCVGGSRKCLLPTPDEFPRFEGGRKPDSWDGNREPGKEGDCLWCGS